MFVSIASSGFFFIASKYISVPMAQHAYTTWNEGTPKKCLWNKHNNNRRRNRTQKNSFETLLKPKRKREKKTAKEQVEEIIFFSVPFHSMYRYCMVYFRCRHGREFLYLFFIITCTYILFQFYLKKFTTVCLSVKESVLLYFAIRIHRITECVFLLFSNSHFYIVVPSSSDGERESILGSAFTSILIFCFFFYRMEATKTRLTRYTFPVRIRSFSHSCWIFLHKRRNFYSISILSSEEKKILKRHRKFYQNHHRVQICRHIIRRNCKISA